MVVLIVLFVFFKAITGRVLISEKGYYFVNGIGVLELMGLHFLKLFAQFSGHKELGCTILSLGEEGKGLHFILPKQFRDMEGRIHKDAAIAMELLGIHRAHGCTDNQGFCLRQLVDDGPYQRQGLFRLDGDVRSDDIVSWQQFA